MKTIVDELEERHLESMTAVVQEMMRRARQLVVERVEAAALTASAGGAWIAED